jgi:hypothetical protein
MRKLILSVLFGLAFLVSIGSAHSQSKPSDYPIAQALVNALSANGQTASYMKTVCQGNNAQSFDNCLGTFTYPNGNIYSGEFKNGKRDGVGVLRVLAKGIPDERNIRSNVPSTFVGEFHDDRINGVGTWFTDSGDSFLGIYKNNLLLKKLGE